MPDPLSDLRSQDALKTIYHTYMLAFESALLGVYALLVPFSTHLLMKKGSRSRARFILLCTIFIPFVLSVGHWAVMLGAQVARIRVYFADEDYLGITDSILKYTNLMNAVILVNYVFGDAVMVWRAYALCNADFKPFLFIPGFCLVLTVVLVISTISTRIAIFYTSEATPHLGPVPHLLNRAIDISQVGVTVMSLATNLTTTAIISCILWRYRVAVGKTLRDTHTQRLRTEGVLLLLLETGIIYFVSSLFLLIGMPIRLPYGTLGDLYTPINVQVAGIYPTLVVVLVGLKRTLHEKTELSSAGGTTARNDGNT